MSNTEEKVSTLGKIGRYNNVAEPFHCDVNHRLFMGHLGNHMLNAADFHSTDRGFGMRYLNTINKTWVLSRLVIEMEEMPLQYANFTVETWVESAMRYFTNRNFCVRDNEGKALGYGRSIWALIDLETRQPQNILDIHDGEIAQWTETEAVCPIPKPGRVKMSKDAELVEEAAAKYSDIDVNGHVNSVKYIEHVLDLFPLSEYKDKFLYRFEIAYVAESHFGDVLRYYREETASDEYEIRIAKVNEDGTETDCVRSSLKFRK